MAISITALEIKDRLGLAGTVEVIPVIADDNFLCDDHGLAEHDVVRFSGIGGGVAVGTNYWVIDTDLATDVFAVSAARGGIVFDVLNATVNGFYRSSEYDTQIESLISELQAGLTGMLDTVAIVTYEAACELGMRDVIAGEVLNMLRRQPGWSESLSTGGINVGSPEESGDKLIERGMAILKPFTHAGYAKLRADKLAADAIVDVTALPLEAHAGHEGDFAPDSTEYDHGFNF